MLEEIEKSHMWSDCFEKAQIGEMIMQAACGKTVVSDAADVIKHDATIDVVEIGPDVATDPVFNDGPHLGSSNGVPGVFSIIALN